jgi:hypothetical protein
MVTSADFNADGLLDLASANNGSRSLSIFFQEMPGSFSSRPLVLDGPIRPRSLVSADLDRNGRVDLVSANSGSDDLTVFFQDDQGLFSRKPVSVTHPSIVDPHVVATADLDRDGDLDLISANVTSDSIALFYQDPPGAFSKAPVLLQHAAMNGPRAVAAADLNRDGRVDIVSGNSFSNNLMVFFQAANGTFPGPPTLINTPATLDPVFAVATDIDFDGDLDILSANAGDNSLTVFFGYH